MPETTGQTYQRYSPGTNERVLSASFQSAGTVSSGLVVFAENARTEPRKSSTWYAEAPGAGAHAKRRARGFVASSTLPFCTRPSARTRLACGWGAQLQPAVSAAPPQRRCLADLHPHVEEQQAQDRHCSHADEYAPRAPSHGRRPRSSSIARAAFESAVSARGGRRRPELEQILPSWGAARGSGRLARADAASSGSTRASSGLTTSRFRGKA